MYRNKMAFSLKNITLFFILSIHFQIGKNAIPRTSTARIIETTVQDALSKHQLDKFVAILQQTRFYQIFTEKESFTIFAPTDQGISNQTQNLNFKDMRRFAEYHIYPGRYESLSIRDGGRLTSIDNNKAFVNRYYNRLTKKTRIWIQEAEVVIPNLKIGNSLVHIIDQSIHLPKESLFDYLERSGGHSIVLGLLKKYRMHFQFPFGVTFLAPFDGAFDEIPTKYKESILRDDVKCRTFLRNHIISRPMSRRRLFHTIGWSQVINNVGKRLYLHQNLYNKEASFVNSATVMTSQQVSDGYVYGITEALLPDIDKKLMEVLEGLKCRKFIEYLKATGHLSTLTSLISVHTVFAPTDQAFKELDSRVKTRLTKDEDFLRKVVDYHLVLGKHLTELMNTKQFFKTTAMDGGKALRLFVNNIMGSVQESQILNADNLASNGIVHVIDKVLLPPEHSSLEIIQSTKSLRLFRGIYDKLDAAFREMIENESNAFTLFLPTNRALKTYFYSLNTTFEEESVGYLSKHLWKHVLRQPFLILNSGSRRQVEFEVNSQDGGNPETLTMELPDEKDKTSVCTITQYESTILEKNKITKNGIVHLVDKVFVDRNGEMQTLKVTKKMWKDLQKRWSKGKGGDE